MNGPISEPPDLPSDMRLDPTCEQTGAPLYWWVIRDDGLRTSWQSEGNPMNCPVCKADLDLMPDCEECVGRGRVDHIPFAPRAWDEIIPNLWLGGHDCQFNDEHPDGVCWIKATDKWRVVVSLFSRFGQEPLPGITHLTHRMADAELDPEHHDSIDELADIIAEAVRNGRKTLVRCHAGLNRSGLVAGLAMIQLGYSADEAIALMREKRSPYVLCNSSFVDYLHAAEKKNKEIAS